MSGQCPPSSELTALLDLGLDAPDRERVQSHLLDCYLCRDELAGYRRTRELLNRSLSDASIPAQPSDDLSARLIDIAGHEAHSPLRTRPFDGARAGTPSLPSRARRGRRRVLGAGVVLAVLVALVGSGWLAAPEVEAVALAPGTKPRVMLAESLERRPLGADPALTLLSISEPDRFRTDSPVLEPSIDRSSPLTDAQVTRLAHSGGPAEASTSVSGLHRAWLRQGEHTYEATARIDTSAEQGSEVSLYDSRGVLTRQGHLPDGPDRLPMSLLASHYGVRGFAAASFVAGAQADVLEASSDGRVRARWWVDSQTSMLLWHTAYGVDGGLIASAGLLDVRIEESRFVAHLGPAIARNTRTDAMSLTAAPGLAEQGWSCSGELAGLPLTQIANARPVEADSRVVYSSYGDGVDALVVGEQNGALSESLRGWSWDSELQAYRDDSVPTQISWQSGRKVFTVTASADNERLRQAVAALPHEPPLLRTRSERILAGWRAMFGMRD